MEATTKTPAALKMKRTIIPAAQMSSFMLHYGWKELLPQVLASKSITIDVEPSYNAKSLINITMKAKDVAININMDYPGCKYTLVEKEKMSFLDGERYTAKHYKWIGKQKDPLKLLDHVMNVVREVFYRHVDELEVKIETSRKLGITLDMSEPADNFLGDNFFSEVAAMPKQAPIADHPDHDAPEPDYDNMAKQQEQADWESGFDPRY